MTQPPHRPLTELTSQQVLDATMTMLQTHVTLQADGSRCRTRDLWHIILTAVAQHSAIEAACAHLATAPDANTIRGSLTRQWSSATIPELEQQVNAALRAVVPTWLADKPLDLAIDTHDMPYYGRSPADDRDSWVVRGQAKRGTTHHYRCATAYVIVEHARVTLAVVFMRGSDTLVSVGARLLSTVRDAGDRIGCLYADKGFCTVAILRYLQDQQIPAIIAAPIRGKQGGTRALCQGTESHWATHTFSSADAGSATVKIAVVRTYAKRHGKKRATWCLFVCLGVGYDVIRMREDYRKRFGIESSYRIVERLRVRTSSRSAGFRFLLMGVALLVENSWIAIQWRYLHRRQRGPRRVARDQLRLPRLCAWIVDAVTAIYGMVRALPLAPYRPYTPPEPIL